MKNRVLGCLLAAVLLAAPTSGFAKAEGGQIGFELLRHIYSAQGNAVFSPYSACEALAMVAAGAAGQTREELLSVLGARGYAKDALDAGLTRANAAFISGDVAVLDSYRAALTAFDAELFPLEADIQNKVNQWVREKTGGLIETLMDNPPDPLLKLALINALTLDAQWDGAFLPAKNYDDVFHCAGGADKTVTYLYKPDDEFEYAEKDGVQIAKLPYRESDLACYLLLPAEGGTEALLDRLCEEGLGFVSSLERTALQLALPKLDLTDANNLNGALKALGVVQAYTDDADFSGIDGTSSLRLSEISQKARLIVDEKGTRAAAATQGLIARKSALILSTPMKCDRPFVLLVADVKTDTTYFAACVGEP